MLVCLFQFFVLMFQFLVLVVCVCCPDQERFKGINVCLSVSFLCINGMCALSRWRKVQRCRDLSVSLLCFDITVHCPGEGPKMLMFVCLSVWIVYIDVTCALSRSRKVQRCWRLTVWLFVWIMLMLPVHCPGEEGSKDVDVCLCVCLNCLCWCYLCIVQVRKSPKMLMLVNVALYCFYLTCALSRWRKVQRCWCTQALSCLH